MKFVVGGIIALLLLLGLAPLWGWIAAVLYGVIAWAGGLFADAPLADGRLAFRAGVMLGGLVSVGAMLRVAWKDRSHAYLIAASALAAGFLLVLVGTSLSPGQQGGNRGAVVGSAPSAADVASARPSPVRRWASRSAYERDAAARVQEIARAAARGRQDQAHVMLEELKQWVRRSPRPAVDQALYQQVWKDYEQTYPETRGSRVSPEMALKRYHALRRLWELSSSNIEVGMQMLIGEISLLYIDGMPREHGHDGNSRAGGTQQERLHGIHTLQLALLAYEPCMPELWKGYATAMTDADEEIALGALHISQWCQGEGRDRNTYAYLDTNRFLLASDLRIRNSMLSSMTGERAKILAARAEALPGVAVQAAPTGGEAEAAAQSTPSVNPETVMPPAGSLIEGKGLALMTAPAPPAAPPEQGWGSARVDLATAGFREQDPGIRLVAPGVTAPVNVILVLDVWKDGRITSVLVESSSGKDMLDQAARDAAQRWSVAGKVAATGERRRVTVAFEPPLPVVGHEDATAQARGILGRLLMEKAAHDPPRYPSAEAARLLPPATVLLSITLSADGRVREVVVAGGSGYPALDNAARDAASRWDVQPPAAAMVGVEQVTFMLPVAFDGDPDPQ